MCVRGIWVRGDPPLAEPADADDGCAVGLPINPPGQHAPIREPNLPCRTGPRSAVVVREDGRHGVERLVDAAAAVGDERASPCCAGGSRPAAARPSDGRPPAATRLRPESLGDPVNAVNGGERRPAAAGRRKRRPGSIRPVDAARRRAGAAGSGPGRLAPPAPGRRNRNQASATSTRRGASRANVGDYSIALNAAVAAFETVADG